MSSNALQSLWGKSPKRPQTILTPACILDPVRELFGGSIGFDPCPAEGSLVDPEACAKVPWRDIWDMAAALCRTMPTPEHTACTWAYLQGDIPQKDIPKEIRKECVLRATEIKKAIYAQFSHTSGCVVDWPGRTFCNPVYGNKGPETTLGTFRDFCAAFARSKSEAVMLCPVRSHRDWWCRDVLGACDAITYLAPVKFEGFSQTFPAPLCLAYKGPRPLSAAYHFAPLGKTYTVSEVPTRRKRGVSQ